MTAITNPLPKLAGAYGIGRRNQIDQRTPVEAQIAACEQAVECLGADPLLTDALIHLQKGRDLVADWLEGGQKPLP